MRPAELDRMIRADLAAGKVGVAVVATAGTVNTGAVDPLRPSPPWPPGMGCGCTWTARTAARPPAAARLAATRAALASADSIALDAHKWLYAPVDAGLLLIRDGDLARDTFSLVPPYLRTDGDEAGRAAHRGSPSTGWSRPARSAPSRSGSSSVTSAGPATGS